MSLTAALNSFSGDGFGVGVSHSSTTLEYSVGAGFAFSENEQGRAIMAITHEETTNRTVVTAGIGWSF